MNDKTMRIITLVWAAILIAMVSSTATLLIAGQTGARWMTPGQAESVQRYARLDEVRDTLMSQYYQQLDEDTLLLGAIRGMTDAVEDPYTFYYTPEEMQKSNENNEGVYHGIGVLIQRTDAGGIQVLRVYEGTPAEAAGLQVDDLITAVDGVAVDAQDDKAYNDAIAMIRGEDGTTVQLTILRDGVPMDVDVARGDVSVSYGRYQMLNDGIGYLSITQFTGDARNRFAEALDFFAAQGARGMVIDLRNNPGGLLDQVVAMADSILPQGIIVYIQDREGTRQDYYSDGEYCDIPLVVLVNDMSASASEIMAASVQCFERGAVVGTTTYGKGIVQTLITFQEDGAGMQLTTSSYYDGNGRSIHGTGVTPDILVELEGDGIPLEPDPSQDNQLAAAIAQLEKQISE